MASRSKISERDAVVAALMAAIHENLHEQCSDSTPQVSAVTDLDMLRILISRLLAMMIGTDIDGGRFFFGTAANVNLYTVSRIFKGNHDTIMEFIGSLVPKGIGLKFVRIPGGVTTVKHREAMPSDEDLEQFVRLSVENLSKKIRGLYHHGLPSLWKNATKNEQALYADALRNFPPIPPKKAFKEPKNPPKKAAPRKAASTKAAPTKALDPSNFPPLPAPTPEVDPMDPNAVAGRDEWKKNKKNKKNSSSPASTPALGVVNP